MKKKILFYLFIISICSTSSVHSQITISPEIGISYLPFTLYPFIAPNVFKVNSKKVNLLLGVSAQVPIHKKWNAKLRISYTDRNDVDWIENTDFGPDPYFEWNHKDINIDLNLHYKLYKNLSVGVGPSLTRSFFERNRMERADDEISQMKGNKFFFALNSGISLAVKRVTFNLMYLRIYKYDGKMPFRVPIGNNRIDFTIGYRIGKGR